MCLNECGQDEFVQGISGDVKTLFWDRKTFEIFRLNQAPWANTSIGH